MNHKQKVKRGIKENSEINARVTEPYPFQKIGIFRMVNRFGGRALLADDVGLGKSIQALYASMPYRHKRPIIIVCPNAVKYGFQVQVTTHTKWRCWICESRKPPAKWPPDVPEVIIINWEILQYWLKALKELNPSVVIGDEIHYGKNPKSARGKAFIKLCKNVKTIYCLSGTPIENGPIEFWVPLHILRPDLFPEFKRFAFRYSRPKHTPWGWKFSGAQNQRELNKLLRKHLMVRRTKTEVLKDLPEIQRTTVPLMVDMRKYKVAEEDVVKYLMQFSNPKDKKRFKAQYAKEVAKLNYLLQIIAELKLKQVIAWIKNFLDTTDKKLTVFAHHRVFLEALQEEFKNESVLVYGGIGHKNRRAAMHAFVHDPKKRLFLGSITATGTGVNDLQLVCSDMAIVELIWVGMKLLQVEGRLHRIGQKHQVNVYYLVASDTAEEILCNTIRKKQKDINSVVDNKYDEQEFDIFDSVFKKLTRRRKIK